jgi:hypothetical protein
MQPMTPMGPAKNSSPMLAVDRDSLSRDSFDDRGRGQSVLRTLDDERTIGSTVDPMNGDVNPYGLDIAKTTSGLITQGDLVVCNFNDSANVQGTGTTIVSLHPQEGATPTHIAQDPSLLGCNALATAPSGPIWTADFASNDNAIVSATGTVLTTLPQFTWHNPFGQIFASRGPAGAAFYESNAGDGSVVRINLSSPFTFDVIATGFAVNGGAPGGILGPSGLQYDAKHDRLYVVDGTNNTVVALRHVSTIPNGGVVVNPNGTSFSGPFRHRAKLVFSGAPLNGPISSALLPNGNLVIGNTLDPNGFNLMVEITPNGRKLDVRNVDTGASGSIFGMVASGGGDDADAIVADHHGRDKGDNGDTKVYFNDDNANAVFVLKR